jgi:hypothetical protein
VDLPAWPQIAAVVDGFAGGARAAEALNEFHDFCLKAK